MDESIKVAFQKVKQDIDTLSKKIENTLQVLNQNQEHLDRMDLALKKFTSQFVPKEEKTGSSLIPAHSVENPAFYKDNPTNNTPFNLPKAQIPPFSTGNGGVPADRQTDQQTDQQTEKVSFSKAVEILGSFEGLKTEIKNKFKKITDQEFLVFSTIYQIEEELGCADYKVLSQKLNLTESSIRDYVGKLIQKGIPLDKTKVNNKIIQLTVSDKLRKIAPLSILFRLREM